MPMARMCNVSPITRLRIGGLLGDGGESEYGESHLAMEWNKGVNMGTLILLLILIATVYLGFVYFWPRNCPNCRRPVVPGYTRCPYCNATYPPRPDPLRRLREALERTLSGSPHLVCIQGPWQGRAFPVGGPQFNLGKAVNNHLRLEEPGVADYHAVIAFQHGRYVLYDYGTSSGTYVNGRRISRHELQPEDRIQIGRSVFVFQRRAPAAPRAKAIAAPPTGLQGLTLGRKISGSGALLALFCFFLPWVELSCAGTRISASGMDLATNPSQTGDASWILFLVPLAALAVLVSVYLALSNSTLRAHVITAWEFIAGLVGLVVTSFVYFAIQDARNNPEYFGLGFFLHLLYGYWGTLAGFVAVIVGALLDWKEGSSRA